MNRQAEFSCPYILNIFAGKFDEQEKFIILNNEDKIMNDKDKIMNIEVLRNDLYNQTPLKIFSFLSINPDTDLSAREISNNTDASKGATHNALQTFLMLGIVSRQKKGNVYLYRLNQENPLVKQYKIFENILLLTSLIQQIRQISYKIILFGNYARGENNGQSDIDLFVETDEKEKVQKAINEFEKEKMYNVKPVIHDSSEIVELEKDDKPFFDQVKEGIILWEGRLLEGAG